ncbi:helix-turn-helix transcriptional regulator [Gracilibacillus caseinilyticus]|uniref:Helix-turn-helix transcriptional regulator n=1 Tax=Gracilibacillus caseinilyticus TaxID=2932256 RepID=A0ABY4F1L8_9BACI|nr:helix-turn-helix transcriptional regulator [Gracilibacillus caseinilyticus]UOQ50428.1 helix-turn-helix transcriptional regulator [Gracilibacillus caseinilyticus]
MQAENQYWKQLSNRLRGKYHDSYHYRKKMVEALQTSIFFDAYCCTIVNPHTLTSVGAVTESSIDVIHQQLLISEYKEDDVHLYKDLVQNQKKIGRLSDTFGEVGSRRYDTILKPHRFSDEIRVALMEKNQCYGFLTLFKKEQAVQQSYFSDTDVFLLENVAPIMAQALRSYYHAISDNVDNRQPAGTGIILLNQDLQIISSNDTGSSYLQTLQNFERSSALPKPIQAIGAKLITEGEPLAPVFVPIINNVYLVVSASFLQTESETPSIAITLNKATSRDMLFYLMEVYRLTLREKEVVLESIRGIPAKEIADNLNISYYTVQDHLKVIFQKAGVTTRNELIWTLFSKYQ